MCPKYKLEVRSPWLPHVSIKNDDPSLAVNQNLNTLNSLLFIYVDEYGKDLVNMRCKGWA